MRPREVVPIAALAALLVCAAAAPAQRPDSDVPDPAKGYKWQDAARKHKLNAKDVEALAKQKVLMTNEAFKQVFDPYIKAKGMPLFITSDSLLNVFHVLYEESVVLMEQEQAKRLPKILRFIWDGLPAARERFSGRPDLVDGAWRRARVMVGTALALLGEKPKGADEGVARLIDQEVRKVIEAKALEPENVIPYTPEQVCKPAWLGPPDAGFLAIDYSRYRPRGFYTASEDLKGYFRAVSWLQSIPFRVAKDEELVAALMLGHSISEARLREAGCLTEFRRFFSAFRRFIGVEDDWDAMRAGREFTRASRIRLDRDDLRRFRTHLLERAQKEAESPLINDVVRFPPDPTVPASEPNFRILSAYRTPDAVLFFRTTDLRDFPLRGLPSGLEVAASLGSEYARARVPGPQREKVLRILDETRPLFRGRSLYYDYLDCLRCLLDEPEPDAPAFMRGEPWQAKSCQAALAGWSQMRHTWALQAKQTVHYLGLTMLPPGFVEPEPEFFGRMARFVEETQAALEDAGVFKASVANLGVLEDLQAVIRMLERADLKRLKQPYHLGKKAEDRFLLGRFRFVWNELGIEADREKNPEAYWTEALEKLRRLAGYLERGEIPPAPKEASDDGTHRWPPAPGIRRAYGRLNRFKRGEPLRPLWERLAKICRRLETLAHKQLRGVPLSEDDEHFIKAYGCRIAGVMLYGGNSYLTPCDDAPRAIDVHYHPLAGKYLEVGIARPRALYVLYPYKGGEVLCRGAVMPYYEFHHGERLTDTQWKALLDSKHRPDVPAWVKPIVGSGGIGAAKLPED